MYTFLHCSQHKCVGAKLQTVWGLQEFSVLEKQVIEKQFRRGHNALI